MTLFGITTESVSKLVGGIAGNPLTLAMLMLNMLMVVGWIGVLMVVARSRTEEMRAILQILSTCLKGGS